MQAEDRLLMVSEATASSTSSLFQPELIEAQQRSDSHLAVQHVRLPQQYISARYPLLHAAISQDGMDIAVAGTRGLGLYSRRSSRWRLFGDISQEREIMVQVCIVWQMLYWFTMRVALGIAFSSEHRSLMGMLCIMSRSVPASWSWLHFLLTGIVMLHIAMQGCCHARQTEPGHLSDIVTFAT